VFLGRPSVRPSRFRPFSAVDIYFARRDIAVVGRRISIKLDSNFYDVSGNC